MLSIQLLVLVGALKGQFSSYKYDETSYYPTNDNYPTNPQYPTDDNKGSNPTYPESSKDEKFGSDIKNTSPECQLTLDRVREAIGHESIKDCFPQGSLYFDNTYTGCKSNCIEPMLQVNSKIVEGCFSEPSNCQLSQTNEGVSLENLQNSTNTIYHQWTNPKLVQLACQKSSITESYCIKELQKSSTKLQNSKDTGYPVRNPQRVCTPCAKNYINLYDSEVFKFPTSYFDQIQNPLKFRDELNELCKDNYHEEGYKYY